MPSGVAVSSSGRRGRRRVRVSQCAATLEAEMIYGRLIEEGRAIGPGWHDTLAWQPHGPRRPSWPIKAEVRPNSVWRLSRLFLRCPHCQRRATRVYIPVEGLPPRCRTCWGLSYASQAENYKRTAHGHMPCPAAHSTALERMERRQKARQRYERRRPFLVACQARQSVDANRFPVSTPLAPVTAATLPSDHRMPAALEEMSTTLSYAMPHDLSWMS
jgi:hypothetical protein